MRTPDEMRARRDALRKKARRRDRFGVGAAVAITTFVVALYLAFLGLLVWLILAAIHFLQSNS